MHFTGQYVGTSRTLQGDLTITLAVADETSLERLERSKGSDLSIDIKKVWNKRSNEANRYMWELCTRIASALGSDKDTIYLLELGKYGVYEDIETLPDTLPILKQYVRYVEIIDEYEGGITVRCYLGSSHYDTKQMSIFIDGVVNDARDLGIDTWTRDEIEAALSVWRAYG